MRVCVVLKWYEPGTKRDVRATDGMILGGVRRRASMARQPNVVCSIPNTRGWEVDTIRVCGVEKRAERVELVLLLCTSGSADGNESAQEGVN